MGSPEISFVHRAANNADVPTITRPSPSPLLSSPSRDYARRMGRTFLLLTIAATRLSIPLAAGTVSMQASSNQPFSPPGTTYCTQSSIGPVSCSINFNFSDPTGRNSVGGQSTATADFGSITGFLVAGGTNSNLSAFYQSSFGDYVTVLGGSGEGTLITHYHLVSSDSEQGIPASFAVPPLYRVLQGGDAVAHTPDRQSHGEFDRRFRCDLASHLQ